MEKNPALDDTGKFFSEYQSNHQVSFLAGTFGGQATRKCMVPLGKAILFPVINYESSFADDPSAMTEKELEDRCRLEMDKVGRINASLDGQEIDVLKYRVRSKTFTLNVPPDNCLGTVSGTTRMASDGYWLFIEPLSSGIHQLTSFGSCLEGRIKIDCTFQLVIE
jgi:hypothetical protein